MSKTFCAVLVFATLYSSSSFSQTYSDALVRCYAQSATAEDRQAWVSWMVSNLLLHPALKEVAAPVAPENKKVMDQNVMKAFERLTLVACRKEAIDTIKNEGEGALNRANHMFAALAINGYLSDPTVGAGLQDSLRYFDKPKWDELGREAGVVAPPK